MTINVGSGKINGGPLAQVTVNFKKFSLCYDVSIPFTKLDSVLIYWVKKENDGT
jgi:hypothetical protein